jgi:uncharacterized membrane protein YgdD (TMEM256/DUF423 family)
MYKPFLKTACLLGVLSVILGAFGAHTLKGHISDDAVNIFETAVRYQFYHVFALLAAGMLYQSFPTKYIKWAGTAFIMGMILFCGSLYFLTYIKGGVIAGYDWVGIITPFGGLAFINGWMFLFLGIQRGK